MRDLLEFFGAALWFVFCGLVVLALLASPWFIWGGYNVPELNRNAPAYLKSMGYEIVGREGYTAGLIQQPGGCVWFTMKQRGDDRTIYTGCVSRWHNGTYELWNARALNAVSGH